MGFSGRQHEHNMGWRLFQCFQQRIEGFVGQHVNFINDINFVAGLRRRKLDILTEFADFVNSTVGSGVNLIDIHRRAIIDQITGTAMIAGSGCRSCFTVQRLRQYFGCTGFACAPRTGEQIRMGNPP